MSNYLIKIVHAYYSLKKQSTFFFYVLTFFKKRDIIQGGTLFKGGHYSREDTI